MWLMVIQYVSPNFSTLQNAIDHLRGYFIPVNLEATIHCAGEDFNLTMPVEFNHPDGQQIRNREPPTVRFTTYVSASNATNTAVLAMDTTGIKVGDAVRVTNGGNPVYHAIHKVIAVTATTVTCQLGFVYAFAFDGALAVEVTVWKTRFLCDPTNDALYIGCPGLDNLRDIQFISDSTTNYGILCLGTTALQNLSVYGFGTGMMANGTLASVSMVKGGVGWCATAGFIVNSGAFLNVLGPSVFNNCSYGLHVRQASVNISSSDDSYYSVFINNYVQAIRVDSGGISTSYYIYIVWNTCGLAVLEHSTHIFSGRPPNLPSTIIANGDAGSGTMNVWAASSGVVHGSINPGGVIGPVNGHLVDNAYINIQSVLLRDEVPVRELPIRRRLGRLSR